MHIEELTTEAPGTARALVFETDDEVIAGLKKFARDHGISAAQFTALGAFRTATLAFFDWETREYRDIPVDEQTEVASLSGDLTLNDDGHAVHAHCVLGKPDGSTVAGHLRRGVVRPTLELFLVEYDAELRRVPDQDSGLDLIRTGLTVEP